MLKTPRGSLSARHLATSPTLLQKSSRTQSRSIPGCLRVCNPRNNVLCRVLTENAKGSSVTPEQQESEISLAAPPEIKPSDAVDELAERKKQRQREQLTYQFSAIAATSCMIFMAVVATYTRFHWHHDDDIPWEEVASTLLLVAGGVFGMEMWARFAHRALWHDYEPGWALHKSHHAPRTGPFEDNDIFAIINGVPAMALCAYGFFTPGIPGGVCFGAGLGITLFGIMYMFCHDGLVHRRFPVGPLAQLPYMKKIAVAHQLHHSEKYGGVPWGMFLGPQELEAIPGAKEELERLVADLDWSKR